MEWDDGNPANNNFKSMCILEFDGIYVSNIIHVAISTTYQHWLRYTDTSLILHQAIILTNGRHFLKQMFRAGSRHVNHTHFHMWHLHHHSALPFLKYRCHMYVYISIYIYENNYKNIHSYTHVILYIYIYIYQTTRQSVQQLIQPDKNKPIKTQYYWLFVREVTGSF